MSILSPVRARPAVGSRVIHRWRLSEFRFAGPSLGPAARLILASCTWAATATAQDRGCRRDLADSLLAQRYAPVLHFAPGEQFFPTLPFRRALTGRQGEPALTNARLTAAPLRATEGRRGRTYVDMDALTADYLSSLSAEGAPSDAVVRYRVRCLDRDAMSDLYKALSRDRQAAARSRLRTAFADVFDYAHGKGFAVVEYYFYYLRDAGVSGHLHDTEKVFIFVPTDSADAERFRVVVGAGHTPVTPNNVLVLTGRIAREERRVHVLVERGGHACSPDLPPYGELRRGWDINWYLSEDVWGTRDAQSVAGVGYVADYDEWKTMPRDNPYSVVLRPAADDSRWRPTAGQPLATYALLSDDLLRAFYRAAIHGGTPAAELASAARTALGHLATQGAVPGNAVPTAAQLSDTVRQALLSWGVRARSWHGFGGRSGAEEDVSVVERNWPDDQGRGGDADYNAEPVQILKSHLYAVPVGLYPELTLSPYVNPWIALVMPMPAPGGLHMPGTVTLRGSYYGRLSDPERDVSYLAGVTYDSRVYRLLAWYVAGEYAPDRPFLENREGARPLVISAGLTIHPVYPVSRSGWRWQFNRLRVRLGARADWGDRSLNLARVRPEVGASLMFPTGPWLPTGSR